MPNLSKILKTIKNGNLEQIQKEIEGMFAQYSKLKSEQWASSFYQPTQLKKELPVPRLELRWREELIKEFCLDSEISSRVCDLCIVSSFMKEIRYNTISSTKSSDINSAKGLCAPARMQQDTFALMYQLKIPSFISFKDEWKEIKFPQDKLDLALGVKNIMKQEDLQKLD